MATLADTMTSIALELLTKFGQSLTLKSYVSEAYNPALGDNVITYTSVPVNAVIESYKAMEVMGRVQADDLKVTIENAGTVPTIKDKLTIDTIDYDVVYVEKVILQGSAVIYTLQVRL